MGVIHLTVPTRIGKTTSPVSNTDASGCHGQRQMSNPIQSIPAMPNVEKDFSMTVARWGEHLASPLSEIRQTPWKGQ